MGNGAVAPSKRKKEYVYGGRTWRLYQTKPTHARFVFFFFWVAFGYSSKAYVRLGLGVTCFKHEIKSFDTVRRKNSHGKFVIERQDFLRA